MKWFLLGVFAICALLSLAECNSVKKSRAPKFIRCRKDDRLCLTLSAQQVSQKIFRGIPSLGIKSSDPLLQEEISGILRKFIYNFTHVSSSGAKGCVVKLIRFDKKLDNLKLDLVCSNFTVRGGYDIHGELIGRKVNEASKFILWSTSYELKTDMKLSKVLGDDGKKYLVIANVTTHSKALGPLRVKLEHSKDLERFLNAHWKELGEVVGLTFVVANVKEIAARTNKFLKSVPIDDLFLNMKKKKW